MRTRTVVVADRAVAALAAVAVGALAWAVVAVAAQTVTRLDCARVVRVTRGADFAGGDQKWIVQGTCQPETTPALVLPAAVATTWAPGVRGIPARAQLCATVAPGGNVQAAIDACPVGQVVQLEAGTFEAPDYLRIDRGITLRGRGPALTRIVKPNGAVLDQLTSPESEPVIIIGAARWPHIDPASPVRLLADAVHGATSVRVARVAGLVVGGLVLLDDDDYGAGAWRSTGVDAVWASPRVLYQRHDPPRPWIDDPFPDSLSWFSRAGRPVNEIKEIASIAGDVVTFTTPIHAAYTVARAAELSRFDVPAVRLAGVEDLAVVAGSDGAIRFEAAAYSWARNVDVRGWLGAAIDVNASFRVEVRDSIVTRAAWRYPGGGGYGLSLAWGSSEVLIENNAISDANKLLVMRSSGAGSVVGYNALDDGQIANYPGWVEVGLNGSHMVGGHHVLFEGNDAFNYDSDNTHGTAFGMTVFRNWLRGRRASFPNDANARAAGLMFGSWHHAFVGNVLGEAGRMAGWVLEDPGPGPSGGAWGVAPAIWRLGYDPTAWEALADPETRATITRIRNFDYVTGTTSPGPALPASLYLATRPAFLGGLAWPVVAPEASPMVPMLPARARLVLAGSAVTR